MGRMKLIIMKYIIALLLFFTFSACETSEQKIAGVVTRIYEVPTYKAYSIDHHIVVKSFDGKGHDIVVSVSEAAQYTVGDTITITKTVYK
jgi:hypothetical protein